MNHDQFHQSKATDERVEEGGYATQNRQGRLPNERPAEYGYAKQDLQLNSSDEREAEGRQIKQDRKDRLPAKRPAVDQQGVLVNSSDIRKKAGYIWDYYKLPIIIVLIVMYIVGSNLYRAATHHDSILYVAAVNVAESDEMKEYLHEDLDMTLYSGLYLTADTKSEYYGYSYASEMKIVAALEAGQLDVVLMNREAFDAFSANDYLMELDEFLKNHDSAFYDAHKKELVENTIIIEDNADEVSLDHSIPYKAKTKEAALGLDLSDSNFSKTFGFTEPVYLAVIRNTERGEAVMDYITYLYEK